MRLLLVQHGHPLSKDEDPGRSLAKKGVQDVEKLASYLRNKEVTVETVWESGKKRATQTAEILARALTAAQGTVFRKEGIGPKDPVNRMAEELSGRSGDLMIVGHLPFLSRLVSFLILGNETPEVAAFQQGGAVCMNRDAAGTWTVGWMVIPSMV